MFFVFVALASSSSQKVSSAMRDYFSSPSYTPSTNTTTSSKSYLRPAKFPETASPCPSCLGRGCSKCNYIGVVAK